MNWQSQEKFLAKCTVRIQAVGKSGYGTGFFVAPDLILTCAHVIRKNDQILKQVKFYWQEEEYQAEVYQVPEDNKNIDIALLKVSNLFNEKFVISLFDDPFATGEELYTFGYPDNNVNGEPGTFEIIGLTGDKPPLIKFKEGQVRPGFSGSPLLNLRTGKVCGIINQTRDRSLDLGGKGVPVSVIFQHFSELKSNVIPSNPFIPLGGKINKYNQVFGREKEIRDIFAILNSGSGVALRGDSGIGKSSILQVICDRAKTELSQTRQPVYLDLGRCHSDNDFYAELCRLVNIDFEDSDPLKIRNFNRAIEQYRLLLILDEIQTMTWNGFTNPVRTHIRSLANQGDHSPFRLVVATRKPLNILFPDSSGRVSPFENVCLELKINSWDDSTIRDFINSRLNNNIISFKESEIIKIVNDSQGYPQKVMQLCYQTYANYLQ
ncbi:MAG: trypsin-like peptidase domain-containing protein [Xenococcus sp. (in: cyanobacteria)]